MAKKFTTKISLGNKPWSSSNTNKRSFSRVSSTGSGRKNMYRDFASWNSEGKGRLQTKVQAKKSFTGAFHRKKLVKVFYMFTAIGILVSFIALIGLLFYMQKLTKDLPDPSRPFENEKFQVETSIMYDRNGKELYRLFGDDNRDILKLEKDQKLNEVVPPELKWSFLAAEDIDFYQHPGFDVTGILRCGFRYVKGGSANCGGSTITQQVVKIASLEDNTRSVERKLRELILALQLERKVDDKDKILLLYMNIAPEGGNIYGVKTAARNYYGKDIKKLTLEEAVTLAAIPNNPSLLSPTRSVSPEYGEKALEARREIIFDNLLKYKDKINKEVKKDREAQAKKEGRKLTDEEKEDFITKEKIQAAREKKLKYKEVEDDIKAPHFVFFAKEELQKRPYNDGEAFTLQQINTGGYKIYTTLDLGLQNTALDVVQNIGIGQYGVRYGSKNAALMTMSPKTGEILTMVGSKCYNNREKADCTKLDDAEGKLFDPKVNILTSQQQPGSSIKPFVYYEAIKEGKIGPSSQLADIPIEIGNYKPKNSDGKFTGIHPARYMLAQSRNIPAIESLMSVTPEKLASLKKNLGYSINIDPSTYGPSAALGSQDVYGVEHANAYAILANQGQFIKYQTILKIVDRNGKVVYDLNGKDKPKAKKVLDERAAFIVNDMTNPRSATGSASPVKFTGRDVSGKTGTSEENRDNWFVMYSPDFVSLAWTGNNDNTRMASNAFGSTNVEPWVREYMNRIGESKYFKAKTPYTRPGGIEKGKICSEINVNDAKVKVCEGETDYLIQGIKPPAYLSKQKAQVCTDQQDKLARPIDIQTGNAVEKEFLYARMPVDSLQPYLDKYLKEKQGANGLPKDYCTKTRSPNGSAPWAEISAPSAGGSFTGSISTNIRGLTADGTVTKMEFYLGGTLLGSTSQSTFNSSLTIPGGTLSGTYPFRVVVTNSAGKVGESSVQIYVSGVNPNLSVDAPGNGSIKTSGSNVPVSVSFSGSLSNVHLYVQKDGGSVIDLGVMNGGGSPVTLTWVPADAGSYSLWARSVSGSYTSDQSNVVNVTVI